MEDELKETNQDEINNLALAFVVVIKIVEDVIRKIKAGRDDQ